MSGIRIFVADSSVTYKNMFSQAVAELDSGALVTCVDDGDQALDKIRRFDYDIIIVDAEIAKKSALPKVIAVQIPKAFVLVTARPSDMTDELCAKSPKKGMSDLLVKPIHSSYNDNYDVVKNKMADIYKLLGKKHVIRTKPPRPHHVAARTPAGKSWFQPGIVLIAASTGGPQALEMIVPNLSEVFPAPILVVQHMLPQFTDSLAQNLNQKSRLRVKIAESKEGIEAGTVYIAPGGKHMKLDSKNVIHLDESPPKNGVRPAADVLFESVADYYAGTGVLVLILTGMGNDGARGLAELKEKQNCYCLTQSEETSVVYGMPRAAVEGGYSDKVLDLNKIPLELENFRYSWKKAE